MSGDAQLGIAGQELPHPVVVRVTDAAGKVIPGVPVTFQVTDGGGQVSDASAQTNSGGTASARWTLGTSVGQAQALQAAVSRGPGALLVVTFTATVKPAAASQLLALAGNGQTGALGQVLPESLAVRVADQYGNGVAGIAVTWTVGDPSGSIVARAAMSDDKGVAKAAWTLGARLDVPHVVTATVAGLSATTFTATATVPATARLERVAGDTQRAPAGTALPESLAVRLTLASGAPIQGGLIQWTVTAGGGTLGPATSVTDATGVAKTGWVLGTAIAANEATAEVAGLPPVSFAAQTTADSPAVIEKAGGDNQHGVPGQFALDSLIVLVRDRYGNPVPEAVVAFATTRGNGTVASATANTDASGRAATRFTLGQTGTENEVMASVGSASPATFSIVGTPGADWALSVVAGVSWTRAAGSWIPGLQVRLTDGSGRGLEGASVVWSATDSGRPASPTTLTGVGGVASNSWKVSCVMGTQVMTATVTGVTPATIPAKVGQDEPPILVGSSGLPTTAPPHSTHTVVLTTVGRNGCPVSGVSPGIWPIAELGRPPTGMTVTGAGPSDAAGRITLNVTLGGYIGGQCLEIFINPPGDSQLCTRAVLADYSRFEIVPDPVVLVGRLATAKVGLAAADPEGRPVWGAYWRSLDTAIVQWIAHLDYTATVYAMRNGTGRIVAWIGDRADTAFVRVEGVTSLGGIGGGDVAEGPQGVERSVRGANDITSITWTASTASTTRQAASARLTALRAPRFKAR
ncbi:MAG TPA: Ig-like domain-containing protein [Gemmatimonadaceae bacterium]|nr:Ig-like domain-containing protein [Gemmatimonadaceae bacterium]